jgi:hypothetical protein
VVQNSARAEDLIVQNKANFLGAKMNANCCPVQWLGENCTDCASAKTKPIARAWRPESQETPYGVTTNGPVVQNKANSQEAE